MMHGQIHLKKGFANREKTTTTYTATIHADHNIPMTDATAVAMTMCHDSVDRKAKQRSFENS